MARDRNPDADLRVGDMNALPWEDGLFDVVTSFRGIWGTTPGAVAEVYRVLVPGGRVGLTVWGHIKASPGAWAFAPFTLAADRRSRTRRPWSPSAGPGAGEALLADAGFTDVERIDVPFVFEFADPEAYARALASTGPAFEAIQAVGEKAFLQTAADLAREKVRDGLPLRAPHRARRLRRQRSRADRSPAADQTSTVRAGRGRHGLPRRAEHTRQRSQRLFDDDLEGVGYVTNVSRLWAYLPAALEGLSDLMGEATLAGSLTLRQRAVLVTAAASTLGDSYCSMAWGKKLADGDEPRRCGGGHRGRTKGLDASERALAQWARLGGDRTRTPSTADDVQASARRRLRRRADLRHHDVRRAPAGLLHRQRRPGSTSRLSTGRIDAGAGSVRRHVRPPRGA